MSRAKLAVALVMMSLAAYVPAVSGGFVWDDDDYLADNVTLSTPGGLQRIWLEPAASPQYYPLVFTSFWLEHSVWGFRPTGYHLVNILLHAANAVLLWRLLTRLEIPGAWLAAAVFALHPVHVESVAWVQERKNVLSGLFYLAAFLSYLHFAMPGSSAVSPAIGRVWYALALAFAGLALLSKTATCTLPAALLVVLIWKRGRLDLRDVVGLLPMFLFAVGLGLMTARLEKEHVGAHGPDWELGPLERLLIAGRALCFYAGKLAWPAQLTFIYPRWQMDSAVLWQYLFPSAVMVVLAVLFIARRRLGGGPLVAALFFAGTLAPTLGFFNFYFMRFSFVADHFQYLASIGLIALAVAVVATAIARFQWPRFLAPALGTSVLLCLAVLTWQQSRIYRNQERLWKDTVAKNPDCWLAHCTLGIIFRESNRSREALPHFEAAIRLRPHYAKARYNLGLTLLEQGRFHEAARQMQAVVEIDPAFPQADLGWGIALAGLGKLDEAAEHFAAEIRRTPESASAHYNLGVVRYRQGRLDEAVTSCQRAVDLAPTDVGYRLAFAALLRERGDLRAAEVQDREAERLRQSR